MSKPKILFDLINKLGEGMFHVRYGIHILDVSENDKTIFRVYHSHGYCFQVEREEIEDLNSFISEYGKVNDDNFYYSYDSEMFEGFKTLDITDAIIIIRQYK